MAPFTRPPQVAGTIRPNPSSEQPVPTASRGGGLHPPSPIHPDPQSPPHTTRSSALRIPRSPLAIFQNQVDSSLTHFSLVVFIRTVIRET
jgi:hypothetical protein